MEPKMPENKPDEQICRWCKSHIKPDALLCKECNKWQSGMRNWVSPGNFLSILGALAAWAAVAVQLSPEPINPTLKAANSVEKFEMHFSRECVDTEIRNCFYDFWSQYAEAWNSVKEVESLEVRNELFSRINRIRYATAHLYKDPNSDLGR